MEIVVVTVVLVVVVRGGNDVMRRRTARNCSTHFYVDLCVCSASAPNTNIIAPVLFFSYAQRTAHTHTHTQARRVLKRKGNIYALVAILGLLAIELRFSG